MTHPVFTHPDIYVQVIAEEALSRGIAVAMTNTDRGEMCLTYEGRSVHTRVSMSELTSSVAADRCLDKRATRYVLEQAGLRIAKGRQVTRDDDDTRFMHSVGSVVVKPACGEMGKGVTVDITDEDHLKHAISRASEYGPDVLMEQCVPGKDLRVVVINQQVIKAFVREPAMVCGTGEHTVGTLIEQHNQRSLAATNGISQVPLDEITLETLHTAGYMLEDVLPKEQKLVVRGNANIHTGGTRHDVTDVLHPDLASAAITAAKALDIPVTGLDMMVEAPDKPSYVFIEANPRPGLATSRPHPALERFIDLLFPETVLQPQASPLR